MPIYVDACPATTGAAGIAIRAALPDDAAALVRLHVAVWRAAYERLAPRAAYERLDEAHRLPGWRAHLRDQRPGEATLIAEQGGKMAGLIRFGAASQPELGPGGEIKHLYVDQALARGGIGRRLMAAAFEALGAAGFDTVALAVVEGNDRALAFYRALGGEVAGRFTDAGPLWRSANLVVRWGAVR